MRSLIKWWNQRGEEWSETHRGSCEVRNFLGGCRDAVIIIEQSNQGNTRAWWTCGDGRKYIEVAYAEHLIGEIS